MDDQDIERYARLAVNGNKESIMCLLRLANSSPELRTTIKAKLEKYKSEKSSKLGKRSPSPSTWPESNHHWNSVLPTGSGKPKR